MEAFRVLSPRPRLSWRSVGVTLAFGVAVSAVASVIATDGIPFLSYNPFPEAPLIVASEDTAPAVTQP